MLLRGPYIAGPAALLVGLLLAAPAGAATPALQLRAERAAAADRCEEALELLERLRREDPSDARAARVAGQCQLRLARYEQAVAALEEAARLAPSPETDLYLGMARYHAGDIEGAEAALRSAEPSLSDRPELHLYLGVIALSRGESARAAGSLRLARRAEPGAAEPIVSFYEGMAREIEGERSSARAAFERARELGQGTPWEAQADAALRRLRDGRPPPWKSGSPFELEVLHERAPRWWASVTAGFEYDDNVVLRGTDVRLPAEIGSEDDERGVYWAEAGYELLATPDWTIGVLASYYGIAHDDLEDFDVHYPGVSVWVDRRLAESTVARLQYDFGYAFVGDAWVGDAEQFLVSHTWTPALYQHWGRAGSTRVFTRVLDRTYFFDLEEVPDGTGTVGAPCPNAADPFCGPPGLSEERARDRDGWGVEAGFDHTLPVWDERTVLRAGYRFHHYDAEGRDYSFDAHEIQFGARQELPLDFALEFFGSYWFKPHRNPSSFPDPSDVAPGVEYRLGSNDRHDEIGRVDVSIERPLFRRFIVSARYAYLNNESNADVFDHDRHIVGVYATFRFAPSRR